MYQAGTLSGNPLAMAGGYDGSYRTGRYIKPSDWGQSSYNPASKYIPHNGLLVSLANAMDVPVAAFPIGDTRYGGELTALR